MRVNTEGNYCEVGYAWTDKVLDMVDNEDQAISYQRNIERRLIKNGYLEAYNEEFKKMLDNGVLIDRHAECTVTGNQVTRRF